MTEPISVDPSLMREIAVDHESIAAEVDELRGTADTVTPIVQTWAPITHGTKAATTALMSLYGDALAAEAASHRGTGDELRIQANAFEAADEANAADIGGLA